MTTISIVITPQPQARQYMVARSRIPSSVCWRRTVAMAASPENISEKITESVKAAEEKCSEDPRSGECMAAWDEVEELSAAASHARDRRKESPASESDPLQKYCKENPGMGQCRIYED